MSDELDIKLYGGQTAYRPGDRVEGVASWNLTRAPKAVEIRLGWFTEGKGTTDSHTHDRVRLDDPAAVDAKLFQFTLPDEPYSFSGKLISLIWRVELDIVRHRLRKEARIIVSPTGDELTIAPQRPAS